jgi:hypothetical protein
MIVVFYGLGRSWKYFLHSAVFDGELSSKLTLFLHVQRVSSFGSPDCVVHILEGLQMRIEEFLLELFEGPVKTRTRPLSRAF